MAQWGVNMASMWASRVQISSVAGRREEAALQSLPASQRDCWHSTPLNSGGQMHFWFWKHVPPFWHRSISSSQTFAAEQRQTGQGGRVRTLQRKTGEEREQREEQSDRMTGGKRRVGE